MLMLVNKQYHSKQLNLTFWLLWPGKNLSHFLKNLENSWNHSVQNNTNQSISLVAGKYTTKKDQYQDICISKRVSQQQLKGNK